jgi:hypothetical protein
VPRHSEFNSRHRTSVAISWAHLTLFKARKHRFPARVMRSVIRLQGLARRIFRATYQASRLPFGWETAGA